MTTIPKTKTVDKTHTTETGKVYAPCWCFGDGAWRQIRQLPDGSWKYYGPGRRRDWVGNALDAPIEVTL